MPQAKPELKPNARGEELYKQHIIGAIYAENIGKYVAFDLKSGEFLIDADYQKVENRLVYKFPEADVWITRIKGSIMDRLKQVVVRKMSGN